jgi:DNA-binding CsgD family transcriptional regulator
MVRELRTCRVNHPAGDNLRQFEQMFWYNQGQAARPAGPGSRGAVAAHRLSSTAGGGMKNSLHSFVMRWMNRTSGRTKLWVLQIDGELLDWLQDLADREQRSEAEVASEMLAFALLQRANADENLRIWRALSPREREVAALVSLGYTNKEIAARLVVSTETVKTHTQRILQKYRLKSKSDLRLALAQWDFSAWDPAPDQREHG